MTPIPEKASVLLERHWGHDRFRPGQATAIEAVIAGRDVLAIFPTGGGKSVCYQLPALLSSGVTLVVSPLISLMHDQVSSLSERGIKAVSINGTLTAREIDRRWTDVEYGRYRLVYVAPERLFSDVFTARAGRLGITLIAVDEAHCISEWGHTFRPSYLRIPEAYGIVGRPPVMALTATATPEVRRDIVERLALRAPEVLVRGFDRPNIVWSVFRAENKAAVVRRVLRGVPGSGLVYVPTRLGVEKWTAWLQREGHGAASYHAGLASSERERTQRAWMEDRIRLVVATSAFGMGIDKHDVRFVIHVRPPLSLEAYYQEAGRAGRDGMPGYAVLLSSTQDEASLRRWVEDGNPDARAVRYVYRAVCNLAQVPIGVRPDRPLVFDIETVRQVTGFTATRIHAAVDVLCREGAWETLTAGGDTAYLQFLQPARRLREFAAGLGARPMGKFTVDLLRAVHADAFAGSWPIDLRWLRRKLKLPQNGIEEGMRFLQERGLLMWSSAERALGVRMTAPRASLWPVDEAALQRAVRRADRRVGDILRYAGSVTCRRFFLLDYFGEEHAAECGRCDICLGRHGGLALTPDDEPAIRAILRRARSNEPLTRGDEPESRLAALTDWLVQQGYLSEGPHGEHVTTPKADELLDQWEPRPS